MSAIANDHHRVGEYQLPIGKHSLGSLIPTPRSLHWQRPKWPSMPCAALYRFSYELDILDKYGLLKDLKSLVQSLDSVPNLHQMLNLGYGEEGFKATTPSTRQNTACSSYLWGRFF